MTRSLAETIAVATGVGPDWLLGVKGKAEQPLTPFDMHYTRDYFRTVFDRKKWLIRDFDPDGDEAAGINALCHELSEVLRTAYAAGKFSLGLYFIKAATRGLIKKLKIKPSSKYDGGEALQKWLFGVPESRWLEERFDRSDISVQSRLMSPTGWMKWDSALKGTDTERDDFLADIDGLKELVATSFANVETAAKTSTTNKSRICSGSR
ncbi:MAG: hypothetical protein QOH39_1617 [Verrucomicrobiota bacterium]